VDVAALALRIINGKVGSTYISQIYTNVKSGIGDITAARGKSIAYGVPISTSNFLIPALILKRASLHPFLSFARIGFSGGHDKSAEAVYAGQYDMGAGHDGVIVDLSKQPGYEDAESILKPLVISDPKDAFLGSSHDTFLISF
jgi:ABC-type phosphate/phosphonate transport system substrate-binding protein